MKPGAAAVLLVAAAACGSGTNDAPVPPPPGYPADSVLARGADSMPPRPFALDTVARGLEVPWAMAAAPDGRIFITERAGRVRILDGNGLRAGAWATLDVFAADGAECGLMGIALAPDFAVTGHVYVYGTFRKTSAERERRLGSRIRRAVVRVFSPVRASTLENRVIRLTDSAGRGVTPVTIVDGLPANQLHAGGALAIGRDSLLYLSTGDAQQPRSVSSIDILTGKVLRYRLDGSIPASNPIPGSPVLAYGLRNVQGLAWHPRTGALLAIEHGPTGLDWEGRRTGGDELNTIADGAFYGWPDGIGRDTARPERPTRQPMRVWPFPLAPGGMAFLGDELFVTGLRGVQLRRLRVERDDGPWWRVWYDEGLLRLQPGRLRAVLAAPDGALYVGTSNRDSRGAPGPHDDMIVRLRFARRG